MVLRVDGKAGGLVMTLPKRTGLAEALRFAQASSSWITGQLEKRVPTFTMATGAEILLRGEPHRIVVLPAKRGLVICDQGTLQVPGGEIHAARRLRDELKKRAMAELTLASHRYAQAMATVFSAIVVRDQKSRWGSCSASGTLSYSWRLILAPPFVLDYVAAHEVAHLREMNHGPRFWRLVLTHCPNAKAAKQWLKQNGRQIHNYL